MAKINAFRVAGRAGRIEGRGAGMLVKVWKIEILRAPLQQFFVLRRNLNGRRRALSNIPSIAEHDKGFHGFQAPLEGVEDRQKIGMTEDDIGSGMIEGVENLLRGQ